MNSRDVVAFTLLVAALGAFVIGGRAYVRLWPQIRPELLGPAAFRHAYYRDVATSAGMRPTSLYDFLDDIWTPAGRCDRRRAVRATAIDVVLLWTAMAHWIGRW
jgi:hypothetical protein